jgi:23S rRNA (uracil1939-C5)-methyltransferase
MKLPKQDPEASIEVELTGWAYGGDALGRTQDGRMVFAPFSIPDERVRGTIMEDHARWARLWPQEWLQRSHDRIDARCTHFTLCGGCHYQHIAYEQQLAIKAVIITDQLYRIGGLSDLAIATTVASPQPWNYRNHMRYHVTTMGKLGFVKFGSTESFVLEACHLAEPDITEIWSQIDLPQKSAIEQVGVRIGSHGDPMIIFHGGLEHLSEIELDFPASLVWQDQQTWRVLAGEATIQFDLMGHNFQVSPPSFFQVNSSILPHLTDRVMTTLDLQPGMTFFDLYAGVGLFSAYAAQRGARVFAIEESPAACFDFEFNLNNYDDIRLYEAPVEIALPTIDAAADVILVDPPRSGLSRAALDAILTRQPARLVYLSCDLGTFARDARRLHAGGYRLEQITPLDLFPQTYHIETLSGWRHTALDRA